MNSNETCKDCHSQNCHSQTDTLRTSLLLKMILMKNLTIIQVLAITYLILVTSCQGFLDREPFADIASDNFYTTEQNMELAAVGLYGTLQDFYRANYHVIAE